jgi:hypothetical protein
MKYLSVLVISLVLATIAACGGGGSGDASPPPVVNPPPPPVGGIGRTGLAIGPITTFGSVVVNGVHYETTSAAFTINDAPGTQSDLRVGQVVTVRGTIDDDLSSGTAAEVTFDDNVKGPVESIDLTANQIVVLGQVVHVGPDTSFDDSISPATIEGLNVGDIVEISGLVAADGTVSATRIELKPGGYAI